MKKIFFLFCGIFFYSMLFGQAPNISYNSPDTFIVGTSITNLTPTNSGGAIPATILQGVSTLAGSTTSGTTNGTGTAASFLDPYGIAVDKSGNVYVADAYSNMIRKITSSGVVSTFAGSQMPGSTNGAKTAARFNGPRGIAVDVSRNVYIADSKNNMIRKVTTAGVVTTLAGSTTAGSTNGTGTSAKFNNPIGIAVDASGNVYVADAGNNMIRRITTAGVVTTLAGNTTAGSTNGNGISARFNLPIGVCVDNSGNVYVADMYNNQIRKISPTGDVTTLAGNTTAGSNDATLGSLASFYYPHGVSVDSIGNVYVADSYNNTIRTIKPNGEVSTLAGCVPCNNINGTGGSSNGIGISATFNLPTGVAVDNNGSVYVADNQNNMIRKISLYGSNIIPSLPAGLNYDTTTGIISGTPIAISTPTTYTVSAKNTTGSNSTNINITILGVPSISTQSVSNIGYTTVNANGNLSSLGLPFASVYGFCYSNSNMTPSILDSKVEITTPITTGSFTSSISNLIDGTAYYLRAFATNDIGTSYGDVVVFTTSTTPPNINYNTPITYIQGSKIVPLIPNNTGGTISILSNYWVSTLAGSSAGFNKPNRPAVDALGNVYVADAGNNMIRKISPAGVVTTLAGSTTAGSVNGTGTSARFSNPFGVAVDLTGNVYVADAGNNMIRKITPTGIVTTLAGSTTAGSVNGTGTAARFYNPSGIAVDLSGNVYVADNLNNMIRKITPMGVVTTLAGSTTAGSVNGTGSAAKFYQPYGVAVDTSGFVYVADTYNYMIRKITPAGVVTTLAGSTTAGSNDGVGSSACFYKPSGVAVDLSGNVYVSDSPNNMIRKISPAGVVTTLAGSTTSGSNNGSTANASFFNVYGVTVDNFGNVYVADGSNNMIRKIAKLGYSIYPALPSGLTLNDTTGIISGTPTSITPATDYTITSSNIAGYSTVNINLTVSAISTNLNENHTNILIYPNPTKNGFTINNDKKTEILLYNSMGVLLLKQVIEGKTYIDISNFTKGIYLLKSGNYNEKIIKN